jgi:hypothetical protein
MLSDKAVEAIQASQETKVLLVEGLEFTTRPVFEPNCPSIETLEVCTLGGFVDYIRGNLDGLTGEGVVAHIISPTTVALVGAAEGRHKKREVYCRAEAVVSQAFQFGRFCDAETFIVGLLSHFVRDQSTEAILKLVGNLRDEAIRTSTDDGITQQVAVRAGVVRDATVKVPNPVALKPYRTFAEIDQPESLYVVRLQRAEKDLPKAALFEVTDNLWRLEAVKAIKEYLAGKIGNIDIIA